MNARWRSRSATTWPAVLLLALAMAVPLADPVARPAAASSLIEARYAVRGPSAVAVGQVILSDGRVAYDLFYPADLATGAPHPILAWGNGSNAGTGDYSGVLHQLASWGFVIIASTSPSTGTGNEMLVGAQYMASRNDDPASVFYHRLDTTKVGALGHSQGAGGSVLAAQKAPGLFTTIVPIALPAPIYVVGPGTRFDVSRVTGPILFLGGQLDLIGLPLSLKIYFGQVPGAAAIGILRFATHNTIQGTGGGFLGYLTAWLRYRLMNDGYARGAFAGSQPEINTNGRWSYAAEKNLS